MALKFSDEELEQMAIVSIRNYLNKNFSDEYIKKNCGIAIKLLCDVIPTTLKINGNVKSKTDGDRSITYNDKVELITPEIAAWLPAPYVKLF